jgi:phosphoglycerol transferase MdoB-like AlkP superfamily enzyme
MHHHFLIYTITFRRLLVVMGLFTISRFFFFFHNHSYYPDIDTASLATIFLGGLRFDTTAVLYTNLLFLFFNILPFNYRYNTGFQLFQKGQYLFFNSVALAFNCIDSVYFQFVKRRTTFSVFSEFGDEVQKAQLLPGFVFTYWYIIVVWAFLVAVLYFCYGKTIVQPKNTHQPNIFNRLVASPLYIFGVQFILFFVFSGLTIAGLRGGFAESTRPITLSNAGEYCKKPLEMAIVLNTPFSIYKTIETDYLEEEKYFDEPTLQALYNPVYQPKDKLPFEPKNVVLIVLESFSFEYIGSLNKHLDHGKYKGYTPFLDSLIAHSQSFEYSFANGEKSIDALPSATTSLPYIKEPYVTFPYAASNTVNSLASLLKPKGYQSAFFHGAPNGSMGFWAFLRQAGYEQYFGKNEYNNDTDYDGVWGIWDEPFLQFMAQKLNTFKQPFVATCFTLSSHDPNKVPAQYEGKFPKGTLPVHQCIGYSDMALKRFFETASKTDWYKNTIFVLTADHTNQAHHPEYKTDAGIYRIPIIFYEPSAPMAHLDSSRMVQQIDILPSVLGRLHYDLPFVSFGKNVFDPLANDWAFNYNNGTYQYFYKNYLLQWRDNKTIALYDFKKDKFLKNNLAGKIAQQPLIETQLKAFLQQYTHRIVHDELRVK